MLSGTTPSSNTPLDISVADLNIETVVELRGLLNWNGGNTWMTDSYFTSTSYYFNIYLNTGNTIRLNAVPYYSKAFKIIIEYTKSTD